MYYFKDHLNFSNNLQDNLYILRQRQLKEAAYSPSSGGPAVPESAAGTNELKDRMRNIKQSGDRPQSKEYKEMEAEVNRREGTGSRGIPQSSDVKTDKVAGDWVERYARKLDMDPRKVENIRRGVIDMDTSGRGEDPISQTQDQVAQRGVEAYDKAKQYVVDMQKRDADKKAKTDTGSSASAPTTYRGFDRGDGLAKPEATPPTTPSSRPYSDRGEGLAKPEATTSVTPEDARSARVFAVNRMTGEGQAQQIMRAFQYTDNPLEYSPKPSQTTPPPTLQREMDKWGQGSMPNNSGGMQNANQNPVIQTPVSGEPGVLPKSYNIPDTGADSGGYGPPKPSTEYSTDLIDQGKLIIGQESVNDILDRMRNPKERSLLDIKTANTEAIRKEVDDQYNKQKGSDWARNSFSLKNYFELRRDGAAAYAQAKEDYKTASSKPSWANSTPETPVIPVTPAKSKLKFQPKTPLKSRPNIPRQ